MKTKFYLLLVLLFFSTIISAQIITGDDAERIIPGSESILKSDVSNIPADIQFRQDSELDFGNFDSWLHKTFNLSSDIELKLLNIEEDQIGMNHYRYQQTFKDLPLELTMFIVHTKNNRVSSMNGLLFDQVNFSTVNPGISETDALNKALKHMNAESYMWQYPEEETLLKTQMNDPNATWFPKGELVFAPKQGDYKAENYRLAYKFDIYAVKPLKRDYIYVDALTGEIIMEETRIHDTNISGTACTGYSGLRSILTDFFALAPNRYRLREDNVPPLGRGADIETYNMNNGTVYGAATDFVSTSTLWCAPFFSDQYALDAHWGTEKTWDFYWTRFARNSYNGAGATLRSYVHYDVDYRNAFWDGSRMTYGDGYGTTTPLTSLDITGHEISHGVTEFTSDLDYSKEPGALNESFSDCMGNSIRNYGKGSASIDWLIGDEINYPFRDMSNPKNYSQPDTYLGLYWHNTETDPSDNFGVHTNSGVMNHWYYLVSVGGAGTNDNGHFYIITGIGITKAAAITYRMQASYNVSTTVYAGARLNSIRAAVDLYGVCSQEVKTVTEAWAAVGVYGAPSPFTSDLWSKDNTSPNDIGLEPNPDLTGMWQSKDIWVRNQIDFSTTHQNPEYNTPASGKHNYVKVVVRNRGSRSSCGTEFLTLQWAKVSSGLSWPAPWDGTLFYLGQPLGGTIGTQAIPVIASGSSTTMTFTWDPPNPALYGGVPGSSPGHFCLISRIRTSLNPPYGMTFPELRRLSRNVRYNNNIVWRNLEVVDLLPNLFPFVNFFGD